MKKSGIILIDKKSEMTSQDVLNILKKKYKNKYGHCGTLDPLATGLLVVTTGNATKLSKYILGEDKEYIAEIVFGIYTDTLDITGDIISKDENFILDEEKFKKVVSEFIGKIEQVPPIYSAIKHKGKKLYELARKSKGKDENFIDILNKKKRNICIYNIEILNIDTYANKVKIKIKCSSGTYIRSLARDIGEKLGTSGCIYSLRRTKIGKLDVLDAYNMDNIKGEMLSSNNMYIPSEVVLKDFIKNKIYLEEKRLPHFINGVFCSINENDGIYLIYTKENNNFIGIGEVKNNKVKRKYIDFE